MFRCRFLREPKPTLRISALRGLTGRAVTLRSVVVRRAIPAVKEAEEGAVCCNSGLVDPEGRRP